MSGRGLGNGGLGNAGGTDGKRDGKRSEVSCTQQTPLRCARVAYEITRDVVGLGDPIECFLANMGRRDRGWDGRKLQMTQDTRDHRLLGNGCNDPE